jgi:hypothetical protein
MSAGPDGTCNQGRGNEWTGSVVNGHEARGAGFQRLEARQDGELTRCSAEYRFKQGKAFGGRLEAIHIVRVDHRLYVGKCRTGPQTLKGQPNDRCSTDLTVLFGDASTGALAAATGHDYCGYIAHVSASLVEPLHRLRGCEYPGETYRKTILKSWDLQRQCCIAALVLPKKLAKL